MARLASLLSMMSQNDDMNNNELSLHGLAQQCNQMHNDVVHRLYHPMIAKEEQESEADKIR